MLISAAFLMVLSLLESLGLPTAWLNSAVYYGTLYGPFGWVYANLKRRVASRGAGARLPATRMAAAAAAARRASSGDGARSGV